MTFAKLGNLVIFKKFWVFLENLNFTYFWTKISLFVLKCIFLRSVRQVHGVLWIIKFYLRVRNFFPFEQTETNSAGFLFTVIRFPSFPNYTIQCQLGTGTLSDLYFLQFHTYRKFSNIYFFWLCLFWQKIDWTWRVECWCESWADFVNRKALS